MKLWSVRTKPDEKITLMKCNHRIDCFGNRIKTATFIRELSCKVWCSGDEWALTA